MAKRLILEQTPHDRITSVLEKLRSAGIKAPAGAMVDSDVIILVEQADVARAIQLLALIGIEGRIG
jgi:hypothetical protein